MTYTIDHRFDVFISYAHFDNEPGPEGVRWVTQLHDHLRSALRQRLGRGADDLSIFLDSVVKANQQLPELLEAVSNSAVLLVVGSRAWASRDWTLRELETFCAATNDPSRIFLAEYLPLHHSDSYPPQINDHLRIELHSSDSGGLAIPFSPVSDAKRFRDSVHRLAEQIGERLMVMRHARAAGPAIAPARPAAVPPVVCEGCCVLIAQPTDDLGDSADQLDHFLRQYGIQTKFVGNLPQGGLEFASGFERHLSECSLFVQLLGPYPGRKPPDLPIGYTVFQAQAAQAAGIEIMQWRRPDVDPAAADPGYAELLDGETVILSSFEEFKEAVKNRILARAAPPPARKPPSALVFIDADPADLDVAKRVQKEFAAHKFAAAVPSRHETAEEARLELQEYLVDSDVIIFLYGASKPTWIKGQLKLYTKLQHQRESEPKLVAIYTGPPQDKDDIGFVIPEARELTSTGDWNMEPIRGLIMELQR